MCVQRLRPIIFTEIGQNHVTQTVNNLVCIKHIYEHEISEILNIHVIRKIQKFSSDKLGKLTEREQSIYLTSHTIGEYMSINSLRDDDNL